MERNSQTTQKRVEQFGTDLVKISWLIRIAREWAYSSGLVQKEYTEKAILTLWLLRACSKLPLYAVNKFLRLSARRALHNLQPLLDQGLIQKTDEEGQQIISITEEGLAKVSELAEKSAAWQRNLVGDLPLSASELRVLATFTEKVLERVDKQLKTWVLGRTGL